MLEELIKNYPKMTREAAFAQVKGICGAIENHLRKQKTLLIDNLPQDSLDCPILKESENDRAKVSEEMGQLVMVHVDEPEYVGCLSKLLQAVNGHIEFSERFYAHLRKMIPKENLDGINSSLEEEVFTLADFDKLHTCGADGMSAGA